MLTNTLLIIFLLLATKIIYCVTTNILGGGETIELSVSGLSSHKKHSCRNYTFCSSLPENILSLMPTSNSLTQKYIHFIQSTFTSVDTQPFVPKGIP